MPNAPKLNRMGRTTGDDEERKAQKHPVKSQVFPTPYEVNESDWYGVVGQSYQAIGSTVQPDDMRIPGVTKPVGHESRS